MAVTRFKLTSAGRSDRRKRITESYSSMIENRQMSRAVTVHFGPFSLRGRKVATDNGETLLKLAMERSKKDWMKTVGKQRDRRDKASSYAYLKFSPVNYISISIFIFMFYSYILHNHLSLLD